ncbi:orotidine-5'-phosphate decarboxylase [Aurantivibrio infirmus]
MTTNENRMSENKRIIVALDYDSVERCYQLVEQLDPAKVRLKVGNELFTTGGPDVVRHLASKNFDVFLDLKYHDIPNTVAHAVKAAAKLGVWMVNVHASGGSRMMQAARDALNEFENPPLLIGVSVLTSMAIEDLKEIGLSHIEDPQQQVLSLASLAQQSGLDGLVCSGQEAALLKSRFGESFKLVTPGIRPAGGESNDQRRILTPEQALELGSDYLVIGRPITAANDPALACEQILATIQRF